MKNTLLEKTIEKAIFVFAHIASQLAFWIVYFQIETGLVVVFENSTGINHWSLKYVAAALVFLYIQYNLQKHTPRQARLEKESGQKQKSGSKSPHS